jgi:antitoxin component of MazEF toxin-antitoxin module
MTMTIFQVGNSAAITIPRDFFREMNFKFGQKLMLQPVPNTKKFVVSPVEKIKPKTGVSLEFKKWLNNFLDEDGALLDELEER